MNENFYKLIFCNIQRNLDGPFAPKQFKGSFNLKYKVGPKIRNDYEIKMEVSNNLKRNQIITNVVATLKGEVEPGKLIKI